MTLVLEDCSGSVETQDRTQNQVLVRKSSVYGYLVSYADLHLPWILFHPEWTFLNLCWNQKKMDSMRLQNLPQSSHFRVFFSVIAILCNHMGTQQTGANYR